MGELVAQAKGIRTIQEGLGGLVTDMFPDIFPGMFDSATSGGDPEIGAEDKKKGYVYKTVNGVAFRKGTYDPHAVSLNDIDQGSLGDCYFMAALGAVAKAKPDWIKGLITENKDPKDQTKIVSYTVTFYDSGLDPVKETVTPSFPVNSYGNPVYAQPGDWDATAQSRELWPMIMEKAYAQWYEGYEEIDGGYAETALRQLTGKTASSHSRDWSYDWYYWRTVDEPVLDWVTRMSKAFDAKKAVIVDTKDNGGKKDLLTTAQNKVGVVGSHSYVLMSVKLDGSKTTVTLYNPHGHDHPILSLTEFEKCVEDYNCLDEGLN